MKIFKDQELTIEVTDNLDLGMVSSGKTETYEYYIVNETSNDIVDLIVSTLSSEIEIINHPSQIKAHESAKITLTWTPSTTIKKGLNANLLFNGSEIIKPRGY